MTARVITVGIGQVQLASATTHTNAACKTYSATIAVSTMEYSQQFHDRCIALSV